MEFRLITHGLGKEIESILNQNPVKAYLLSAFITYEGALQVSKWIDSYPTTEFLIITGTYLDFTNPEGIYLLAKKTSNFRVIDKRKKNLHAKAYLFIFEEKSLLIIGSANLSKTALYRNIEWSGYISKGEPGAFSDFIREFEKLWNSGEFPDQEWIETYRLEYRRSNAAVRARDDAPRNAPSPRFAQIEALENLATLRELGEDKALVVMATGLGKTHLAAFDSAPYSKVLFIAHRKEILRQARKIFAEVRGSGEILELDAGWWTKERADVLLATVQKLSRSLSHFKPTDFNYIVIDEFHHAKARTYQRIIEYFDPIFLLGMTATPFRMDRKDITELCDQNVPYAITFVDAIEKKWLSPFHYYGIYDESVNYEDIPWRRMQGYDTKELEKATSTEQRAEKILMKYLEMGEAPAIGFCVSIAHADFMADFFNRNGVPAIAVHSKGADPTEGKNRVNSGDVDVIFAVDVFNEGVDLPKISTVLFLRPTESLTTFLQQMGRGLRLAEGKQYLLILDFVGNYKKSFVVPTLLLGKIYPHLGAETYASVIEHLVSGEKTLGEKRILPEGCEIHFDMKLVDLMKKSIGTLHPVKYALVQRYLKLKQLLGTVSIQTLVTQREPIWNYIFTFGSLYDLLKEVGDLTDEQQSYSTEEINVLRWIERKPFYSQLPIRFLQTIFLSDPSPSTYELCELVKEIADELPNTLQLELTSAGIYGAQDQSPLGEPGDDDILKLIKYWLKEIKFRNRNIECGILINDGFLQLSPSVRWDVIDDDVQQRISLRHDILRTTFSTFEPYNMDDIIRILSRHMPLHKVKSKLKNRREGIIRFDEARTMILFVNLDKNSKNNENTMYEDHLTSTTTFEWESQNQTTLKSTNGRVITGELNYQIHLFVRLRANDPVYKLNFFYMGKVRALKYEGERPIKVLWELEAKVPPDIYDLFTNPEFRKYKLPKSSDLDISV